MHLLKFKHPTSRSIHDALDHRTTVPWHFKESICNIFLSCHIKQNKTNLIVGSGKMSKPCPVPWGPFHKKCGVVNANYGILTATFLASKNASFKCWHLAFMKWSPGLNMHDMLKFQKRYVVYKFYDLRSFISSVQYWNDSTNLPPGIFPFLLSIYSSKLINPFSNLANHRFYLLY